jgi:hypothetical protein
MAAQALAQWLEVSGITEGPIFRRILKGGRILEDGLDPTAVRKIVQQRCPQAVLSGASWRFADVKDAGAAQARLRDQELAFSMSALYAPTLAAPFSRARLSSASCACSTLAGRPCQACSAGS